jgi:ABC-type amino acid transport substrate-binding protein
MGAIAHRLAWRLAFASPLLIALSAHAAQSASPDRVLRVCINEDAAPFSKASGADGTGFDVALAAALAAHLGRSLQIQWYESKFDEDASVELEADALLSDGRCDLLAGYALIRDGLGKPLATSAKLPGFRGIAPADRRRRVQLGTLEASRPYLRAPLALLFAPGSQRPEVQHLSDVNELHFGVVAGTLADAILMLHDHGRLIDHVTHFAPREGEVLAHLEAGEIDAALLPVSQFDAYRLRHPETRIVLSNYRYPVAFNLGYVGLAEQHPLLEDVGGALAQMQASGELAALAAAAGVTYVAPGEPAVAPGITFAQLHE